MPIKEMLFETDDAPDIGTNRVVSIAKIELHMFFLTM
jgi:hypothetical protein